MRAVDPHVWMEIGVCFGRVLPLLVLPGCRFFSEETRPRDALASAPKAADRPSGRVRDLFSPEIRATTLLIWAAAGLCVCFLYIIVNWLPGIVRGRGYSFESSVLMIGLFNTGTLIGALVFGALIDRFGPFKVLPTALLAGGCFLSLLDVSINSRPLLLAASLIQAAFTGGGGGMCLAAMLVLLYPSALRTTGTGWALAIGKLGAALGPIAITFALRSGFWPKSTCSMWRGLRRPWRRCVSSPSRKFAPPDRRVGDPSTRGPSSLTPDADFAFERESVRIGQPSLTRARRV